MKILKRVLAVISIAILAVVLLIGGYIFVNSIKSKNVFDEMYYAWADYPQSLAMQPGYWRTEPLAGHPTFSEISASKDFGFLHLEYSIEYMMPKTKMTTSIYRESCDVDLRGFVEYAVNEKLILDFSYNKKDNILTIENLTVYSRKITEGEYTWPQYNDAETVKNFLYDNSITKEEIEKYKDYFLNEVAIGSWVDGNGVLSKFSRKNPGRFFIIDNTYSLLSEEWQH
jgi:hypothetical protein